MRVSVYVQYIPRFHPEGAGPEVVRLLSLLEQISPALLYPGPAESHDKNNC